MQNEEEIKNIDNAMPPEKIAKVIEKLALVTNSLNLQLERNSQLEKQLSEAETKLHAMMKGKLSSTLIHSMIKDESEEEEKDVEIEIKFKPATPKLRVQHTEYLITQNEEVIKAQQARGWDLISNKRMEELDFGEMQIYNLVQKDLIEIYDRNKVEFFKLIVDDRQNSTEEKKLLRSAYDSEFYQNIDIQEVEQALFIFRGYYKI